MGSRSFQLAPAIEFTCTCDMFEPLVLGIHINSDPEISDLGKVLLHPDFGGLPQWAVVGKFT